MIGIDIKIKNNKIVYLSKFLFLKNPKNPNGKKIKNIGKIDNAADFIRRDMDSIGFNVLPGKIPEETCIAATEWLKIPSDPIVSILTKIIGNRTTRKIDIAIKNLGMFIL